jgi:hypothetical protein
MTTFRPLNLNRKSAGCCDRGGDPVWHDELWFVWPHFKDWQQVKDTGTAPKTGTIHQ